jgi:hypothetical protein
VIATKVSFSLVEPPAKIVDMRILQRFLFLFLSFLLVSCSTSKRQPVRSGPTPDVKDVPFEARDDEGVRQRVLVLPFLNTRVGDQAEVLETARKVLIQDLLRTGRFIAIEPSDFPEDVKKYVNPDQTYQLEELAKKATAMGISAILEGKLLNVQARRTGEPIGIVRELQAEVLAQVQVRVVAAMNGREVLNVERSAKVESRTTRVLKRAHTDTVLTDDPNLIRNSVVAAFRNVVPDVLRSVEKLSWEGRVAMLQGERVYINAGRLSGIQIGDILKITEEGKEIYDPETGRFIGVAPGRMKGTIEVVSYFGKDGAIGIVHSGSGFLENDRVEIY